MECKEIIAELKKKANPRNVEGMARFGISAENTLGIPIPELRRLAKIIKRDHSLALRLWDSGIHEARILAGFIADPLLMTEKQMESWAGDFDSWDVCDQVCLSLFYKLPFVKKKIIKFANDKQEFVKRTAFSLMAVLAVHDKSDFDFTKFFLLIKKASADKRNYVKKAVNWALRQIGKRNIALNKKAIKLAKEMKAYDSKSAKWIASNALSELTGLTIQKRFEKR